MSRSTVVPGELTFAPFRGADAVAEGLLTSRQLDGPHWRRLLSGIYAHADLTLDHLAWCQAAGLALAGRGAISGRSAACVWGADVVPRDAPVEVTVPAPTRFRAPPQLSVVRFTLDAADVTRWAGLPVTTALRTAFDLGRRLALVDGIIGIDALGNRRLVTPEALDAFAATRPGWPGSPRLRLALQYVDPGAESPMETRLRLVLVAGRLPRPVTQFVVCDASGRFVGRLDLAYPHRRLGIEYDGDQHRDRAAFRREVARQNALRACGWTLLRFTATDVYRQPYEIIRTVRAALAS